MTQTIQTDGTKLRDRVSFNRELFYFVVGCALLLVTKWLKNRVKEKVYLDQSLSD